MPISLIHNFTKTISKLLANRLIPELEHLISANQTSFIKKRVIHDNFVYVQQVIKDLHKKKTLSLFIKLDIAKAFDTVNWSYLLHIMSHLGFGQRWHNWVSSLWLTASSSYLLNGEPGKNIMHYRGSDRGIPCPLCYFCWPWSPSIDFVKRHNRWESYQGSAKVVRCSEFHYMLTMLLFL
jgi:hypothetical protein